MSDQEFEELLFKVAQLQQEYDTTGVQLADAREELQDECGERGHNWEDYECTECGLVNDTALYDRLEDMESALDIVPDWRAE